MTLTDYVLAGSTQQDLEAELFVDGHCFCCDDSGAVGAEDSGDDAVICPVCEGSGLPSFS